MKIKFNKIFISSQIVLVLIVLLIYMFFFVDEELLVSLMTTFVLIGAYYMLSSVMGALLMNDINEIFQKISVYILMNLSILDRLICRFKVVSLRSTYGFLYNVLLKRVIVKMNGLNLILTNSINLLVYNMMAFLLLNNSLKNYLYYIKLPVLLNLVRNDFFNEMFKKSSDFDIRSTFVTVVSKIIL